MPVAQTIVLRRVLKGGISMNSGCCVVLLLSTNPCGSGTVAGWCDGLVFGTLLGPEATGPGPVPLFLWGVRGFGFVCFWFPGCIDHAWWPSLGGWCVGCVVRGCCLRTT